MTQLPPTDSNSQFRASARSSDIRVMRYSLALFAAVVAIVGMMTVDTLMGVATSVIQSALAQPR